MVPHDLKKTPLLNLKDNQEVYKPKSIKIYMDMAKGRRYLVKWRGWSVDYNIRTRGISKRYSVDPLGLLEMSQAHKMGRNK